eukprot:jgi/Chlat1/1218/Chrsp115S01674
MEQAMAGSSVLRDVGSQAELDGLVASGAPVVVHFWAGWCEPCQHMDMVMAQLQLQYPHARFIRIEAEAVSDIVDQYGITSVPYFLFFQGGALVGQMEGANPPMLAQLVREYARPTLLNRASGLLVTADGNVPSVSTQQNNSAAPSVSAQANAQTNGSAVHANGGAVQPETEDPQQRMRALVRSAPVVLFMKGTVDAPRCGFSQKVVNALKECGASITSVDVLSDPEVRSGMKDFSNWPTFPQLYVDGEFIGGCDIVLEMHASGELRGVLQEKLGNSKQALDAKLSRLINLQRVVLFMKGSPSHPKCGFSQKVVNTLNEYGIDFGHVDILQDAEVRQGMKELANWPTFPMLFVDGQFVGGCDIVLEMHTTGALIDVLTG